MILFIHRTLLGALDPIIGGFREGGITGGLASLAQVVLNPVERREAETSARDTVRRELRRASPGQTVSDVGGFVERPPAVPVRFAGSRIARALGGTRGFQSVQQFDRTISRTKFGAGVALGAAVQSVPDVLGDRRFSKITGRLTQEELAGFNGGPAVAQLAVPSGVSATGQLTGRMSNFAKDECGNILKFFCSPRPGEGWVQVEDAASLGLRPTKPFSRLDLSIGEFVRMPRRRMNPLNIKALGRANRRREGFIDIAATHLRERRKEREGKKPSLKSTRHKKKK